MTAIAPEPNPLTALPTMAVDAAPLILPGLLAGLGVTRRPVPSWISDPQVAESIRDGFIDIPDDLNPQEATS
ncbi:hypothetical protein [Streptomyces lasiicapitis]|uniref:hypothetical protein n=1 Tax=Streptomyces lasiicapitis TaxID=1923961 RepID=UPI00368757E9